MRDECAQAVAQAAGRSLTQAELKDIEDRITKAMKTMAAADRDTYRGMSTAERMQQAAQIAANQLDAEKAKKSQRIALTISAHDRIETYLTHQKDTYGWGPLKSLRRILADYSDLKSDFVSIERRSKAISSDAIGGLVKAYEVAGTRVLGMFSNQQGIRALMHELYGKDSREVTTPEAAALAKEAVSEWMKTAEALRRRFNANGGIIGSLEDWRLPQRHSQMLIERAGIDKWTGDILTKLDRDKYTNLDGTAMNDQQVNALLREVYKTIVTGGANKIQPGRFTNKMTANRFAEQRFIHFKDPDEDIAYRQQYGDPNLFGVMVRHVQGLAKDISRIETLGPNPDLAMKYFVDKAYKEETENTPRSAGKNKSDVSAIQRLYAEVSGNQEPIANERIATGFSAMRNWMIGTKLGSAFISSIPHQVPFHLTAFGSGLPQWPLIRNFMTSLNPTAKEAEHTANLHGLALDTMLGSVNQWSQDSLGAGFSAKMANAVIRASGLNALNEARHQAMGITVMGSLSKLVKEHATLDDIEKGDARYMTSRGITPRDWEVWKLAEPERWKPTGVDLLTPRSIYSIPDAKLEKMGDPEQLKWEAVTKLLATSTGEADVGVNAPKAADRIMTTGRFTRGTWGGELARQFFLFKTYPMGMITSQWMRGMNMPTAGGRAFYIASLVAGTTALGAFSVQLHQVLQGKDPEPINNYKFFMQALLKGGSTGMYGDFLLDPERNDLTEAYALGPMAEDASQLFKMIKGNTTDYLDGKETRLGSQAVTFLRSNFPGQNLWYTQAVMNRLIFDQMQQMANPDYARRVTNYAARHGYNYWWKPAETAPDRAPDMNTAVQ